MYKASVSAKPGAKISWTVQGISVINNRKFYSYPVRSKEITVPDCKSPAVVANSNNGPQDNATSKEKIAIKIYPNPANSILNISIGGNFTKGTVHVYDALGKELIAKQIAQGNMQLLVNNLSAGIYFIRIIDTSDKLLYNGKFVKQ